MKKKNVLILGVSGQDGSYLAHHLIKKKFNVIGISRKKKEIKNHKILGINKNLLIKNIDYNDYDAMKRIIKLYKVTEIYFFSGQTKPNVSNYLTLETLYSNIIPVYNIIDIILNNNKKIKFFNSVSCEIFENTSKKLNELSKKNPSTIYALSKLISYEIVKFFREKYNLKICSGIMFHHESILRDKDFVLKKIIENTEKIKKHKLKKLYLGNINVSRDWGWAPEFVKLIYKIMNSKKIDDYIIATGKTVKLKTLIKKIFKYHQLNWKKYVSIQKNLKRSKDSPIRSANNLKLRRHLKWKPKYLPNDVVQNLLNKIII
tara:strand:- start:4813 stop:5763 length:951 start_codon:yes stop_codon:yes gene_type:complete